MNFGALKTIGSKVGDMFRTKYGQGTLQNDLSSGNKLKDLGLGSLFGSASGSKQTGYYMPRYNYMGHGLARNDMDYLYDRNSFNPYDASNAISSVLTRKDGKGSLGKLGNIFRREDKAGSIGQAEGNSLSDYIGNETNGNPLRAESIMDYLGLETNYGGYTPQFLPSSFEERGGFDFNFG